MNILDKIVIRKKEEVELLKAIFPVEVIKSYPYFDRQCFSLKDNLTSGKSNGVIAEFKRRSPSKGVINSNAKIIDITKAYCKHGASGISILTDEDFFGGSIDDLMLVRDDIDCPILRKEFIIDKYQLFEAKAYGADVILLIAACLSVQQVKEFAALSKELGLEVLLEIHNEEELEHICDDVDFVGVNNRNLKTFEVDINTSLQLFPHIPNDKLAIAESGISNVDTIVTLKQAGFKGFLIGENFMKESDPAVAFEIFSNELKRKTV